MKRLYGLLGAAVLLTGCGWKKEESTTPAVPAEAPKTAVYVVNVLDKAMYDDAHIKGSVNIEMAKVAEEADKWAKDATIVFYCSNSLCKASFDAAKQLSEKGFTNVAAYEGGMAEWYQLSKTDPEYKIEGDAKQEYLTMPVQVAPVAAAEPSAVKKITAAELQKVMKEANLL